MTTGPHPTMSDLERQRDAILSVVEDLFSEYVDEGERHLQTFLVEMEDDLNELWTVPVERQARFLRRMKFQALGLLEVKRIRTVELTRESFAAVLTAAIRTVIKVLA